MPNLIAYGALIVWPFVTFAIFASMRPGPAVIWSLLAGYLLLPVKTAFDFPGIPALDKTTVANLSTFIAAIMNIGWRSVKLPREWWLVMLMATYLISPMFTVFANQDALLFGDIILPPLKPYDAFSASAYKAIDLIPFMLGYNLLRRSSAYKELLRALVVAALSYSLLMLLEVRLSPQLHTWIYGFFPHSFAQQIRGDGFRPVVFLGHGLVVAIFTAMAVTAVGYLARRRASIFGVSAWAWLAYLFVVLLLCRSFGALLLACAAVTMAIFAHRRVLEIACTVAALVVLGYPMLRGADVVPVQAFADYIAHYSGERAESLQTRIDNEDQLLARANVRPWFGWGGYARNRVFDRDTGRDLSITDGTWIIIVGTSGWVGYAAAFGLLCMPLLHAARHRYLQSPERAAVGLLLVVNLLDLLPNSSLGPLTWLMAGSVVPFALPEVRSGARRLMSGTRESRQGLSTLEADS